MTRLVPLVVFATVLGVRAMAAQDPPDTKSAMTGVFTDEQADKGRGAFSSLCTGCHTVASHTGIPFKKRWNGETVWDLFDTIKETMPDDDPGSVSTEDVTVIVAFLLKANGMPPGKDVLKPDAEVLKKIRIDVPDKQARGVRRGAWDLVKQSAAMRARPRLPRG